MLTKNINRSLGKSFSFSVPFSSWLNFRTGYRRILWIWRSTNQQWLYYRFIPYIRDGQTSPRSRRVYISSRIASRCHTHWSRQIHLLQTPWWWGHSGTVPRHAGICNNGLQMSREDIPLSHCRHQNSYWFRLWFHFCHVRLCPTLSSYVS